ncbi:alpha/beta hydrolase family protein [Oceanibacterium hippocampi]|nr:alpha/beta fold hydrolase [Oceanibacterium hippocampi]
MTHGIPDRIRQDGGPDRAPATATAQPQQAAAGAIPVEFACSDGVRLRGEFWPARPGTASRTVIVNPATGVLASYYHRYARFLTRHGLNALTYDYRGIGASRPASLRGCGYRWRDWGEYDFDAAVRFLRARDPDGRIAVVGHSIGGFLPGLAASAGAVERILTVGAQYAYWPDYAARQRLRLFVKWHLAMPLVTALCGYFPGRRLGWLEDLPAGVANEWSFRRARMEASYPASRRAEILARFDAVTAPLLAIATHDDIYATPPAVRRGLSYYRNAPKTLVHLGPDYFTAGPTGHFGLFHSAHEVRFWRDTVSWLVDGANPWRSPADGNA